MKRKLLLILICVLSLCVFAACSDEKAREVEKAIDETVDKLKDQLDQGLKDILAVTPAPTKAPEPTEVTEPTEEPVVTDEPEPTEIVKPTEVMEPTATPKPTATPTPEVKYTKYRFRNYNLLDQHYEKHGIEMGFDSRESYEKAASDVINNPKALHKTEAEDGDYVYYVEDTNEFVVLSKDGYIRTYFLPSGGKKYYDRQ